IVQLHQSGCSLVMIPPDKQLSQLTRPVRHLIRAGSITDDVAQIHNRIERWRGRQTGVESFQVGMNVAGQQYAHRSPDELPIIDWMLNLWDKGPYAVASSAAQMNSYILWDCCAVDHRTPCPVSLRQLNQRWQRNRAVRNARSASRF